MKWSHSICVWEVRAADRLMEGRRGGKVCANNGLVGQVGITLEILSLRCLLDIQGESNTGGMA